MSELFIGVDTEGKYQNDTEPNVEENVEDVKERRFAETEQIGTVE